MIAIPGKSGQSLVVFWLLTILAASAFFWLVVPALGIPVASALALLVPALVLLTCIVSGRCTFNSDFWALFLSGTVFFELTTFAYVQGFFSSVSLATLLPSLPLVLLLVAAAAKKGMFPFGLDSEKRAFAYGGLFSVAFVGALVSSLLTLGLCEFVLWGDTYSKSSELMFQKLSTSVMPCFILFLNGAIASTVVLPLLFGLNFCLIRSFTRNVESDDSISFQAVALTSFVLPICLWLVPFFYAATALILNGNMPAIEVKMLKYATMVMTAVSTIPMSFLGMQISFFPVRAGGVESVLHTARKGWRLPSVFLYFGIQAVIAGIVLPLCIQMFQVINPQYYNYTQAELYHFIGREKASIAVFDKTISVNPRDPRAYVSKGNILLRSGRAREAAAALQQGYDQGACSPWLLRMMVESYEKQGKIVEASKYRSHLALNYEKHLEWCKSCKRIVSDKGR